MKRIDCKQALWLHDGLTAATGGESGLRERGLLESALNAPFQSFGGIEPYPSVLQKAARLCYGIVMNHPFVDGNKRSGAHIMLIFLALNGIELRYTQEELAQIILEVASGKADTQALYSWIAARQK